MKYKYLLTLTVLVVFHSCCLHAEALDCDAFERWLQNVNEEWTNRNYSAIETLITNGVSQPSIRPAVLAVAPHFYTLVQPSYTKAQEYSKALADHLATILSGDDLKAALHMNQSIQRVPKQELDNHKPTADQLDAMHRVFKELPIDLMALAFIKAASSAKSAKAERPPAGDVLKAAPAE